MYCILKKAGQKKVEKGEKRRKRWQKRQKKGVKKGGKKGGIKGCKNVEKIVARKVGKQFIPEPVLLLS
jgi:hypothetical protein